MSALYPMFRQFVVQVQICEFDVDALVDRAGVSSGFVERFKLLTQEPPLLEKLILGRHLLALITSSQACTRFEIKAQSQAALANTGCSVGSPWPTFCITSPCPLLYRVSVHA